MKSPDFSSIRLIDYSYPPDHTYFPHTDRFPKISILLSGQVQETAVGKEEWASTTSVVFKPNDIKHSNRFGPKGARIISIVFLNPTWIKDMAIPCYDQWFWLHGIPTSRAVLQLVQQLEHVQNEREIQDHLIEFLAALPLADPFKQSSAPPSWLHALTERLREECHHPLSVRNLAQNLGIHPVYLARVFRKWHHCSIKEFIHRQRLRKALDALTCSQQTLVDIAYDNGYADQSHFNRYFKSNMDISPGKFRSWAQTFQVRAYEWRNIYT